MRIILFALLLIATVSCSKKDEKEGNIYCCGAPAIIALIDEFKESNKDCNCLSGIRESRYKGERLIEFYYYDPSCFAMNRVFDVNGTEKFRSGSADYADYFEKKTDPRIRWTCEDGDQ